MKRILHHLVTSLLSIVALLAAQYLGAQTVTAVTSCVTEETVTDIVLDISSGRRMEYADLRVFLPAGLGSVDMDNVYVNVIGRGEVSLRNLPAQRVGKVAYGYPRMKVGEAFFEDIPGQGRCILLKGLDLRPSNGTDVRLRLAGVKVPRQGSLDFGVSISGRDGAPGEKVPVRIPVVRTVSDLHRIPETVYEREHDYTRTTLEWTPVPGVRNVSVEVSYDLGSNWSPCDYEVDANAGKAVVRALEPGKYILFRLKVRGGRHAGYSNCVVFRSGEYDARVDGGAAGDGVADDTDCLNALRDRVCGDGGGSIRFSGGTFCFRTLHMRDNVWLLLDSDAVLSALPGTDEPEETFFSGADYRHGLSPTDYGPYREPENYLTKQDDGHTYFHNSAFFGERVSNVKILGSGRITGAGNLTTSDRVMNNPVGQHGDKLFCFKLCRDIEIGGPDNGLDMWYDPEADEPYYFRGSERFGCDNMLDIDRGGHFVLLATGTDGIYVHDTYLSRHDERNVRDIYDFMGCNDVTVKNVYARVCSDDIVKLGSDCSLGFTRTASGYKVRNIVGDTNCNLFQIGSETADDISDVYVDNIYVLGANKAGFSISANDGGCVSNIWLNSGRTGSVHSRSVIMRSRTPFFISISNRGRTLGARAGMYSFYESGVARKELLITNSPIGRISGVHVKGVDVFETYAGSSFRSMRWKPWDGSQGEAPAIIAGYKLPDPWNVDGGLGFMLPDGRHTGYVEDVSFEDVSMVFKGGHDKDFGKADPPELGVGRYNVKDLGDLPAFGFWFRHVKDVTVKGCTVRVEDPDGRRPLVLDDVIGKADVSGLF